MKHYRLYQVDAFTQQKFRGNPAGVVSNAEGLSSAQMQAIAREMNCSETAFILPSEGPDHEVHIRYFTPTTEVPVCGHATIAAHYVRAKELGLPTQTCVPTLTGAGILPIEIDWENDDYKVVMTQGKVEFGKVLQEDEQETLLHALALRRETLLEQCPIQIVSTGHSKVLLGITSRSILNQLTPNMEVLRKLSSQIGCNGYFIFTFDSDVPGILTWGRMFAPAIGILEDPVTGNAHGPLGAYLVHHQLFSLQGGHFSFVGRQGEAIQRTGQVEVVVCGREEEPELVQVGGQAVTVFQTEITL
ncbi:PhzF family isomerase [Ktedonobacter racemifer]|uniref:Phenazine biosynthesis protein PhzF family n=1 Tax=Ktedonobacter racemifer DSM 44963 TaxID=485913 RepID=D6U7R9_KTERA|nr:PhzF family isomerase [Ktedonobacter racemifer]EFH79930.1 phenazine biosynthesis protein PhzF family [Ktedonobacter racemifer DSM 44963]